MLQLNCFSGLIAIVFLGSGGRILSWLLIMYFCVCRNLGIWSYDIWSVLLGGCPILWWLVAPSVVAVGSLIECFYEPAGITKEWGCSGK